jgi:hypothetical protein
MNTPVDKAFALAMQGKQYGESETRNARDWFGEGYNAAIWNPTHRWNIDRDGDALLVCDGEHEKSEGCTYVRYVREAAPFDVVKANDEMAVLLHHPPSAHSVLFEAAAKGFHTSETCGPEGSYTHVCRFQSIEDLHAFEDAWRSVMLQEGEP